MKKLLLIIVLFLSLGVQAQKLPTVPYRTNGSTMPKDSSLAVGFMYIPTFTAPTITGYADRWGMNFGLNRSTSRLSVRGNGSFLEFPSFTEVQSTLRRTSARVTPTVGATSVIIPELIGSNKYAIMIYRSGMLQYDPNSTTGLTCTVNYTTGLVTVPTAFSSGEYIQADYTGVQPSPIVSEGLGYTVVQNYADIFTNVNYGGSKQWVFFVLTDNQNNLGGKSKYEWTPTVGLGWYAVYFVN